MTATKRLALILFTTPLFYLAFNSALTQYIAVQLSYSSALGDTLFQSIYHPLAWYYWYQNYVNVRPDVFLPSVSLFLGALVLLCGCAYVAYEWRWRQPKPEGGTHGTARWADKQDLMKSGLLDHTKNPAIHLGGWKNPKNQSINYLRHCGPVHTAVIAPTRAGKGIGVIIPTLLTWRGAMVVYDQKGELWSLTSGWRSRNVGPCYAFSPASHKCKFRFNPLDAIRLETQYDVSDSQNIATIIVDTGKELDHWGKNAFSLLTGLILFIAYERRTFGMKANISDVLHSLSDPNRSLTELWDDMIRNEFSHTGIPHAAISEVGAEMLNKPEKELGSIVSTAVSFLNLYRDPIVARSLSSTTATFEELMNSDRPATLYIIPREENKDRLRPFTRLFFTQLIRVLLRTPIDYSTGKGPHKHELLLLLDEFISLGKLPLIEEGLSYVAGYGIRVMVIFQDVSQLWSQYTKDEAVLANCNIRIIFAPNKIETAEWASRMLGKSTQVKKNVTKSMGKAGTTTGFSAQFSENPRELMFPDEIMRLPGLTKNSAGKIDPGQIIILQAGQRPILGQQTPFFLDPELLENTKIPPVDDSPIPPDRRKPSQDEIYDE